MKAIGICFKAFIAIFIISLVVVIIYLPPLLDDLNSQTNINEEVVIEEEIIIEELPEEEINEEVNEKLPEEEINEEVNEEDPLADIIIERPDPEIIADNIEGRFDRDKVNLITEIATCINDTDGSCNKMVESVSKLLPDEVEDIIVDTSNVLEVINGNQEYFLNYMSDKPIHVPDQKYTGISGYGHETRTVVYSMNNKYIFIHELAHAYDFSYYYDPVYVTSPSQTDEWKNICATDKLSDYNITDHKELYAEAFYMYFVEPDRLEYLSPKAFEYFNNEFNCY